MDSAHTAGLPNTRHNNETKYYLQNTKYKIQIQIQIQIQNTKYKNNRWTQLILLACQTPEITMRQVYKIHFTK